MEFAGKHTRVAVLLFIVLAVFVLTVPITARADTASQQEQALGSLQSQREALQKNIDQIQSKIDEYQKNLTAKKGEIASLKNEIVRINGEIGKLDLEIKKTQNQIYLTRLNIQSTQSDIVETTQNLSEKQQALASLIRELDKIERQGLLERLVQYRNLSDVLSELQYLDSLQNQINQTVDQTKVLKNTLEIKEVTLQSNKKDLEQKNTQLAVQKSAQQSAKNQKSTVLNVTKGEEAKYQKLLNQAEQEQAAFLKELAKIESQILINKNFVNYFQAGTIPKAGTKIFVWPEDNARMTQGYGMTAYAKRGAYGGQGHNGIDITSGIGSPVKAAAGGTVIAKSVDVCQNYIKPSCNGYWGNWVALQHPGGIVTLYSHLSRPSTKGLGESVEASEVIGYEGSTGNVTGPHLHFSVFTEFFTYKDPSTGDIRISYNYNKTLNPLSYL